MLIYTRVEITYFGVHGQIWSSLELLMSPVYRLKIESIAYLEYDHTIRKPKLGLLDYLSEFIRNQQFRTPGNFHPK